MDKDLLDALLSKLAADLDSRDGDAAINTIRVIEDVAGPGFTDHLVNGLIKAGMRRALSVGITAV